MSRTGRFSGKVAFVNGATSGIGRATAQALAAEGASVGVADLAADGARETARLRNPLAPRGRSAVLRRLRRAVTVG